MKKKRVWTSLKDLAEPHKQAIFEQRRGIPRTNTHSSNKNAFPRRVLCSL